MTPLTSVEDLTRAAAAHLAEARARSAVLHRPGERETYRKLLERAIDEAVRAIAGAREQPQAVPAAEPAPGVKAEPPAPLRSRALLATACALKARDALHGAGQLSRSAQRAPTGAACDDGWERVAAISAGAAESARLALLVSRELDAVAPDSRLALAARSAARDAEDAASAARELVLGRNHAFTFHTDTAFSFGEGWYLAAAGLLAGVSIQVEPGRPGTSHAEQFLHAAGLAPQLTPYRPRPRAMKQTTELVARAFAADPVSAQRRLRAAFLGDGPVSPAVSAWLERRLGPADESSSQRRVLLWIRDGAHHPGRNTTYAELLALTACVQQAGLVPVYTGDALCGERLPDGVLDLVLFWKDPIFQGLDMRRAQLGFFECLRERYGVVGQLGVTTAGMDGPALMGMPTLYLTDAANVRMREWVGVVPGYRELVRGSDYLERVTRVLAEWARSTPAAALNEGQPGYESSPRGPSSRPA